MRTITWSNVVGKIESAIVFSALRFRECLIFKKSRSSCSLCLLWLFSFCRSLRMRTLCILRIDSSLIFFDCQSNWGTYWNCGKVKFKLTGRGVFMAVQPCRVIWVIIAVCPHFLGHRVNIFVLYQFLHICSSKHIPDWYNKGTISNNATLYWEFEFCIL